MTLWIILTAMAALAAAWLTIPLVRRHEARVDARAATIAVLKDQLADVDVQLAAGSIQPGEAEGLRNEIRRRLLAAGHIPAELDRTMGQKALSGLALGMAAMVALAAGALYTNMGQPELAGSPAAPAAAPPPAAPAAPQAQGEVAQLITGLEQKMQANPQDPEGWRMLGWSYFQTGRYGDAAKAYARAIALKPDGVGYNSAYGEALVQEAGGQVTPAAAAAFEKAAAQDGADARARYFLAVRMAETGDRKGAIEDWLKLLADSPADAPWLPQLRSVIEQTAQQAKIDIAARLAATRPVGNASVPGQPDPAAAAATTAATAAPAGAPAGVMPSPSREQVQAAQAMNPADRQAMIRGMVDGLAEKLKTNPKDEAGWLRLMRARQVLGDAAAARTARDQALAAFAGDAAAQGRIRAAAAEMGL
ncbi:c-type cytochrome biogenesis protein CcmI [Sandarakinorhabdus cyanobacteriorum]|uniref:C-type cytochrome biogenesis protein CcmI n=1 Tax=Sandarakinorhabdus cyanobacteriorum TaxID=1981098 RepID=A0A255YNU6_9SPHN|nr:c-type cytochrome biogenesis protein CcmI [Sandarakinorhabdus cyanobacteriorum]OYQ30858.1 c-type cytochrome biogenesis protein CcmI [Sandarakinorhabdus cyanobacteriorum]